MQERIEMKLRDENKKTGHLLAFISKVKGEDNLQNNGLWKRYDDWAFIGTDKSKTRRIKSGWEGTGELHVDTTGEYTLLENGVKLYRFPKV